MLMDSFRDASTKLGCFPAGDSQLSDASDRSGMMVAVSYSEKDGVAEARSIAEKESPPKKE